MTHKKLHLDKAFIIGMIKLRNMYGVEGLHQWLVVVGSRLGELEGAGIEGKKSGDLRYVSSCSLLGQFGHTLDVYDELCH